MSKELEAREDIKSAADDAVRVISMAAEAAAKVVENAAGEAVKVVNLKGADDHDLLISMKEQLRRLSEDIKELKDGTARRINELENNKADKDDFEKLKTDVYINREARIRSLENRTASYMITFGLYTVALTGLIGLVVFHILS